MATAGGTFKSTTKEIAGDKNTFCVKIPKIDIKHNKQFIAEWIVYVQ